GVASITELMTKEGLINLDFADVRAIMSEMGRAMMGTGEATGEKRAIEAAEAAISNPLLDDVSMRGARGLLISISGGPDLTLYEVDEAATRIREEVDPEANIILGATFDDSLEGTMRVSVVATGLAQELLTSSDPAEAEGEMPEASGTSFGYTGKQQTIIPKVVKPAPMAARANPVANKAPAPPPQPAAEVAIEDDHETQVAAKASAKGRGQRMPAIEEFPPIAQKQIAAQQNRIEHIAEHAARKKKGLFERLANVGLGRRDDPAPVTREPVMAVRSEPKVQVTRAPARPAAPEPQTYIDPNLDDDQLTIPAFLRRQAN
ncbi:MAG TPA: cell division protein FtsZ, partial [Aestuariivirga sp.]|nr:cell division protein FtsZ [Aestuariivirga sp.]